MSSIWIGILVCSAGLALHLAAFWDRPPRGRSGPLHERITDSAADAAAERERARSQASRRSGRR